ncbi:hypothetical protein ACIHIX_30520 [Streptomyces sp. NPDC051913]|uniref:hypothetical protein n=1 Tax=Streptomyces sp. NPDC051913 TaxID=3365676 RepID=UPI0037D0A520
MAQVVWVAVVVEPHPGEDGVVSEVTGTVVAAVIAFAAAVIGAVIAGVYAKRGAEAGGRKAVEAALAGVHGQAAAEHWQWVRSQRHQAFAALLDAYAVVDEAVVRIAPEVRAGAGLDEATGRELRERTIELKAKTSRLALWGPNEVYQLAHALSRKSVAVIGVLMQAAGASSAGLTVDWSNFDHARDEMIRSYAAFLGRAGEIIRDPMQPVS